MNGLILKDTLLTKSGMVFLALFVIVFGVIGRNMVVPCMLSSVIMAGLASNTMLSDGNCGWDAYAVSSGVPRERIVSSKFISGTMFVSIGTIFGAVVSASVVMLTGSFVITDFLSVVVMGFVAGMLVMSITVAVNYMLGNNVNAMHVSKVIIIAFVVALIIASEATASLIGGNVPLIAVLSVLAAIVVLLMRRISLAKFESIDL